MLMHAINISGMSKPSQHKKGDAKKCKLGYSLTYVPNFFAFFGPSNGRS